MLLAVILSAGELVISTASSASPLPRATISYFEQTASTHALYAQGKRAGELAETGLVILDFGRPAFDGHNWGMLDFAGGFVPLAAASLGVKQFIAAYYRYAPANTTLDVAVGTNNSCGTGQPCGSLTCGCPDEPPDFATWGGELARTVLGLDFWAATIRSSGEFTDDVRVIAADDAEPGFDPGYFNTYDVLRGYAEVVAGSFPAMVDFGSAEANYWSERELLQVAYGFAPDVPMPEVYYPSQVGQWGALLRYAKATGRNLEIFGVLAEGSRIWPSTAYAEMLRELAAITGQQSISWLSTIGR